LNQKYFFNTCSSYLFFIPKEDLQEEAEEVGEFLSNKKAGKLADKKGKIKERLLKIQANISKFEKAIGRVSKSELYEKLGVYKKVLEAAQQDGIVDSQEGKEINILFEKIKKLENKIEESNVISSSKIAPEKLAKIELNVGLLEKKLRNLLEKLGV
jgi:hypothetical protein